MNAGGDPAAPSQPDALNDFRPFAAPYEAPKCDAAAICEAVRATLDADKRRKGDALEELVVQAFGCYPFLFEDQGKRRRTRERDRVFTIRKVPGTLPEYWGAGEIVVDCRNRSGRYQSGDAGTWCDALRESRSKLSLIVAVAGITERGPDCAMRVFERAWDADQVAVAVITGEELFRLCDGQDWLRMLHERVVRSRHGPRFRS